MANRSTKNCYILGCGNRFIDGYREIFEFLVEKEIIHIAAFINRSSQTINIGNQKHHSFNLEKFFKIKRECDFVINLLPSKIKDEVNFELLKYDYKVLSETPFARRPRQAKKLLHLSSNKSNFTLLENANYHPSISVIQELIKKGIKIKEVINRGVFIDYHQTTHKNIITNIIDVTYKSEIYNSDRYVRELFSDILIFLENGVVVNGSISKPNFEKIYLTDTRKLISTKFSEFFLIDEEECYFFLNSLNDEKLSSFCLLFQFLSDDQALEQKLRKNQDHFNDFLKWRKSRRGSKYGLIASLKNLISDFL